MDDPKYIHILYIYIILIHVYIYTFYVHNFLYPKPVHVLFHPLQSFHHCRPPSRTSVWWLLPRHHRGHRTCKRWKLLVPMMNQNCRSIERSQRQKGGLNKGGVTARKSASPMDHMVVIHVILIDLAKLQYFTSLANVAPEKKG